MKIQEAINSTMTWLTGSPTLNLLFLLIAIISLTTSIYLYFKSKKEKQPVYLLKTFPLIENNLAAVEGLSVLFNNKEVKNLSLTKIALWNKGRETINASDIATSDKLRIDIKDDGIILGARMSYVRKPVNCLEVTLAGNSILIGIDFLDHLDGGVIDIYHSGDGKISIQGTIKGVSSISIAKINDEYFLDKYLSPILDPIFDWLPTPKVGTIQNELFNIVTVPLLLPIVVPFLLIGIFVRFFQRVPEEYALFDNSKSRARRAQ